MKLSESSSSILLCMRGATRAKTVDKSFYIIWSSISDENHAISRPFVVAITDTNDAGCRQSGASFSAFRQHFVAPHHTAHNLWLIEVKQIDWWIHMFWFRPKSPNTNIIWLYCVWSWKEAVKWQANWTYINLFIFKASCTYRKTLLATEANEVSSS